MTEPAFLMVESIHLHRDCAANCDPFPGALEGAGEAGIVERLQQVVECAGIECFERVLIVGGDKDDGGGASAPSISKMSKPSYSGMRTSRKTRSGFCVRIASRARWPRNRTPRESRHRDGLAASGECWSGRGVHRRQPGREFWRERPRNSFGLVRNRELNLDALLAILDAQLAGFPVERAQARTEHWRCPRRRGAAPSRQGCAGLRCRRSESEIPLSRTAPIRSKPPAARFSMPCSMAFSTMG